jgi:hypothetical protein
MSPAPVFTAPSLLRELEPLTHDARLRRMVEVGRQAGRDPAAAATLAALEAGGFYERLLALHACHGSRDAAVAVRMIAGPSRLLRRRALKLLALLGSDRQLAAALRGLRGDDRVALLGHLRKRERRKPLDAFLDDLAKLDDPDLGPLLPFGSAAAVERHRDQGRQRGGLLFWSRLARHHPAAAVRALRDEAGGDHGPPQRLVQVANTVLPRVADAAPDEALAALKALARRVPIHQLDVRKLAARRPDAVADLVLKSDGPAVPLGHVAHRLEPPRLLALLRRYPAALGNAASWFGRLPPPERAALFAAVDLGWRDADGCVSPEVLTRLPRAAREAEARRHLALPALATRTAQRLAYAALLPWGEARAALDPWLSQPDPELRIAALAALIRVARHDRARLADVLGVVRARKNEQDPVRQAMLSALAALPPRAWRAEHLDDLGRIIRDALDARDLAYYTAAVAESLAVRLLPWHPQWAAEWIVKLARERGQVNLGSLGGQLTDADVRRIAPALAPVLRAWQTREREGQLLGLAQSLGKRLPAFAALLDIVERLVEDSHNQWVSASVLALLARHLRARFAELVPGLLARDPSWITQGPVVTYLHRRRQDLLTRFLGRQAYRGRFSTGRTRHVLPLRTGFFRWTASQQQTFATTLEEVADRNDKLRDVPAVWQVIGQLAALPAVEPRRVLALAEDPRPAVRDRAVQELGRLDAGQGVGVLLEALGDDRGRVAIYGLRRAVLGMAPAHALDLLRAAPLGKVTVAKEVVRLIGDVPSPDALGLLLTFDGQELHRDVRAALLRALWAHLDRREAWAVLERAAASPDPALMTSVVRIPSDPLADEARRRLGGLLGRLLDHPEPAVRLAVLQRCRDMPADDPEGTLLPRLLAALASALPDERAAAAGATFAACGRGDGRRIARAVAALLPNRRALQTAVGALCAAVLSDRARLLAVARAVLAALAEDALTVCLRVELAAVSLPAGELAEWLAGAGPLHADALAAAAAALPAVAARAEPSDLEALEATLGGSADERLRRLGLAALTASARRPHGWSEARLGRLRAYRADRSPLVAGAAQFTLPPEEVP